MEQEVQSNESLIFGLTPKATLLNGIALSALSGVAWAVGYIKQVPKDIVATAEKLHELKIEVPWYYDLPIFVLSLLLVFRWVEFKFNMQPGEFSGKSLLYKYIYGCVGLSILAWIVQVLILTIFFSYKT